MPYDPDNPPDKLKSLSKKKKRQWVHVYNQCSKDGGSESKCHQIAWGVAKKATIDDSISESLIRIESFLRG